MVIDGTADHTKSTAFDLVDRRGRVALSEQQLAGSKNANGTPGFKG
jgi:hypothetical protein